MSNHFDRYNPLCGCKICKAIRRQRLEPARWTNDDAITLVIFSIIAGAICILL